MVAEETTPTIDIADTNASYQHATRAVDIAISREDIAEKLRLALTTEMTVKKIDDDGTLIEEVLPPLSDISLVSARELWLYAVGKGKPIGWIESYKSLLRYVSTDYADVLQPIIKGTASGTRYYLKFENIVDFLWKFENNSL